MYELKKKKVKIHWLQLVGEKDTQNDYINSECNLKQNFLVIFSTHPERFLSSL
jgi:hypothetical protein